jgi:hypothetical protein
MKPHDAAGLDSAIRWLRTPEAIRSRCHLLFDAACAGTLTHCRLDLARLDDAAALVIDETRRAYPDLDIPYHSRWRHFSAGSVDRWQGLETALRTSDRREIARTAADLAIVSVLLDAGAGDAWRYRERATGATYARSEGLAVASLRMFESGAFSGKQAPCAVDAEGLEKLDRVALAHGFQVEAGNPLVGLDARAALLQGLGRVLRRSPDVFGAEARFGAIIDHVLDRSTTVSPASVLSLLLETLADIWPFSTQLGGVNVGDVGRHAVAQSPDLTSGLVPFHKISQWLTYSLLEPLEWAGATLVDLNALTGLPEYRNGGLFVDCGAIRIERGNLVEPFDPRSTLVVEWRALTVILLDMLAEKVRAALAMTAEQLPLARLLQGGTWTAGRRIASERRPGGAPPIRIATDGTTF